MVPYSGRLLDGWALTLVELRSKHSSQSGDDVSVLAVACLVHSLVRIHAVDVQLQVRRSRRLVPNPSVLKVAVRNVPRGMCCVIRMCARQHQVAEVALSRCKERTCH